MSKNVAPVSRTVFNKLDRASSAIRLCLASGVGIDRGCVLFPDPPRLGLVEFYGAPIPPLRSRPGVQVNYAERVLPMKDGLPKLKAFPAELGGSGVPVPE